MKTNDIKKGWRIQLDNGWYGTMHDNARGNIRRAEVEGMYTEIGSVYAWDIYRAQDPETGDWHPITLTPKQVKDRGRTQLIF